jgi:hypothetical protein
MVTAKKILRYLKKTVDFKLKFGAEIIKII